ncbi:MAG: hypothetical protein Q8O67_19270 [Deltaproteobacteria bacterium]|nr:hypothetical protein [Deltaproteobacteria bacterium]
MLFRFALVCCCVFVVDVRAAPVVGPVRVFVAPIATGAGADGAVVALFDDRVLAAARDKPAFDVVGSRDVESIISVEASRQAAGCDGEMSCAIELAGALDAPQVVSGRIGRVGDTWVLTLTRTERATLKVLSRVVRESRGSSPEGLLGTVDGAVDELFGDERGPSPLLVSGGVGVGVGVGVLVVGTVAAGLSWTRFSDARTELSDLELSPGERADARAKAQIDGSFTNNLATVCWIAGGAVTAIGGAAVAVDLVMGGE